MAIPQEHSDKFFFHFSHISNLDSIVKNGFLSTNEKIKATIDHKDIANGNIQKRRSAMKVPIAPGGTVHDYVPFYFCTRNPMLLSLIMSKNIDQELMIFFAVPINKVDDKNVIFTDASANTIIPPNFYTDPNDLENLDWDCILSQKWGTSSDDEKHRKMAEVLVYQKFDITDVDSIIVWNEEIKKHVEKTFTDNKIKCPKVVYEPFKKKNFYFTKFAMGRPSETFTTGPASLKARFNHTVTKTIEKRKVNLENHYVFNNLADILEAIDNDFTIIEELAGIHRLETVNEVHKENVSDHTLKVCEELLKNDYYESLNDEDKNILKFAAYFHDIGKGPKEKWKEGKQLPFPDHPVDSLKMLKRILVNDIENLSDYEIRKICLLVGYHDLIGEIIGKNRDKQQLFDIIENKKELEMLNCLNISDVLAIGNGWHYDYEADYPALEIECLLKIEE